MWCDRFVCWVNQLASVLHSPVAFLSYSCRPYSNRNSLNELSPFIVDMQALLEVQIRQCFEFYVIKATQLTL